MRNEGGKCGEVVIEICDLILMFLIPCVHIAVSTGPRWLEMPLVT